VIVSAFNFIRLRESVPESTRNAVALLVCRTLEDRYTASAFGISSVGEQLDLVASSENDCSESLTFRVLAIVRSRYEGIDIGSLSKSTLCEGRVLQFASMSKSRNFVYFDGEDMVEVFPVDACSLIRPLWSLGRPHSKWIC
jgi:hypothetical protein